MNKTKNKNLMMNNKNRGFSIIEAMVAIFILTFSITVLMSVVANSISQSRYAKNELTATYLAQEAIDYIRNKRDSSLINSNWDDFISIAGDCSGTNGCTISVPYGYTYPCSGTCPYLRYDENASSGFYNYNSGQTSVFKRTVNVELVNLNREMIVTVRIDWKNNNNSNKSLTMKSSLLNWY